jgi:predicted membrane protein (TIGR00267 family)
MAHKELGIFPDSLEEPLSNALVMGVSYVAGGIIPVLFYLTLPFHIAMPVSIAGTLSALFLFGGLKGRIVKQSWWRSGLEMLGVAGLAALAGWVIGRLVDHWVH